MERERERRISYLNEDIKSIKIAKEGFDKQILQRKDDITEIFELRRCEIIILMILILLLLIMLLLVIRILNMLTKR